MRRGMIRIYSLVLCAMLVLPPGLGAEEEEVRDVFAASIDVPQAPASAAQPAAIEAQLTGIGIGPKGAFVVINGEIFHEGELKQGIKVTKIRKRSVDTLIGSVSTTLRMSPSQAPQGVETHQQIEDDVSLDHAVGETELEYIKGGE